MKNSVQELFPGKEALTQQLADTKLRLALLSQLEQETDALLAKTDPETQAEEERFFAATQSRTRSLIRTRLRGQSWGRFARHQLPKIANAAALLLLVFYLGLTTALATVPSVRIQLMKLLYQVEEEYTAIHLEPDENTIVEVPEEWGGSYYMTFIPSGYAFEISSGVSGFDQEVVYLGSDKKILRFSETDKRVEANVNTEGFVVTPTEINGAAGFIAVAENETAISWPILDRYFILHVTESPKVALQIAQSVMHVK